ncbi:MAG: hemY [Gammaproteobacteria bacterium]|jgi:HemY protein|nr:hemY [Gammaproteobacteria bacterium]
MLRWLSSIIIVLFVAWSALMLSAAPGYMAITYGHWSIETPLWFGITAVAVTFIALYILLRLLNGPGLILRVFKKWRHEHRYENSHRHTLQGLLALAEGDWDKAESLLIKSVKFNEIPLVNYLAAAKAAQALGAYDRRDQYLHYALDSTPGAKIAVGLTQAELQYHDEQWEHCLATLRHIQQEAPQHKYMLKLLKQVYYHLADWLHLLDLLPLLKKQKIVDNAQLQQLSEKAYLELLLLQLKQGDQQKIELYWQKLPKPLQRRKEWALPYAHFLLDSHMPDLAEECVRDALKTHFEPELITVYGQIHSQRLNKQIDFALSLLKQHGQEPHILLCLGQLAMADGALSQANSYLTHSLQVRPLPKTYAVLGALSLQLGNKEEALRCFQQAVVD